MHYACKFISIREEYQQEKEIMLKINEAFKDSKYGDNIANLIDYNDEDRILFYTVYIDINLSTILYCYIYILEWRLFFKRLFLADVKS